jgi:hypothetical protein
MDRFRRLTEEVKLNILQFECGIKHAAEKLVKGY